MKNDFLYLYQEQCVVKALETDKGKIILPTGSGKGIIGREIIFRLINSKENKYNGFVGIIFTPRLILNKQWLIDFIVYFEKQTRPINFIFVGSDKMARNITNKIESILFRINGAGIDPPITTRKSDVVRKTIERNKRRGINTIIISTYHSNHATRKTNVNFDCILYDEAHYIPGREDPRGIQIKKEDFFQSSFIKAKKKYFFTATEKIGNVDEDDVYHGRGMNNKEVYGEEILPFKDRNGVFRRMSPRDLIEFGSILEPRVHIITTDSDLSKYDIDDNIENITKIKPKTPLKEREFDEKFRIITKSFLLHDEHIKKESAEPENIGGKVLVVCNGSAEMKGFINSKAKREFMRNYPDIHLYFISTDTGIHMGDAEGIRTTNRSKEKFLENLRSLKYNERAIIFHIDILTCGLDVFGLTGVLFMRNCEKIKTLQNMGRACRPHEIDRIRWREGKLIPLGEGYIKPHFYVILPVLLEDGDDFIHQFGRTITGIREDYGFKSWEFVHIGGLQPAHKTIGDDNGIIIGGKNIVEELERTYYQQIEERKIRKLREQENDEQDYIGRLIKDGKIEELLLYMGGFSE